MKLHFCGWDEPLLPLAAKHLLREYAARSEGARDIEARMRDVVVVVPGRRAGRRLKELLAAEAERGGARLIPPRVATIGRVPELLAPGGGRAASETESLIAWTEALRSVGRERLEALFARRPEPDALGEWTALAREMARVHDLVASAGLRFGEVAERCADVPGFRDVARWGVLSEVQEAYQRRLGLAGLVDAHLGRIEGLAEGRVSFDGDLWLVGVSELPPLTGRFVRAIPGRCEALVQAPAELSDAFDELGCVRPARWTARSIPLSEDRVRVQRRPSDQATAVTRFLGILQEARTAEEKEPFAAEEIVIGVPDPEVEPHLEAVLAGAGAPARSASGIPLRDSRPCRLLDGVGRFLDGRGFDALATLARHPDLDPWISRQLGPPEETGSAPPPLAIDALDRFATARLPSSVARNARDAEAPGTNPGHRGAAADVQLTRAIVGVLDTALLSETEGDRRLSMWMAWIVRILAEVYGAGLGPEDPEPREFGVATTRRALEALRVAAEGIESHPGEVDPVCSAAAAIRFLLDSVSREAIPLPEDAAAIELVGWLELHLDDAPVVVLTGLNEGRLPATVRSDPFLPDRLRTALGLEDDSRRYARDAYRLTALMQSCAEVLLVTGRQSEAGDPLRPSRLLFAGTGETAARRILRFYGDGPAEETAGPPPERPVASDPRAGPIGFPLPPHPELRYPGPVERLRVTDFRAALSDPYRFVLDQAAGRPEDDDVRELDPLRFGTLTHRVLELFGRDETAASDDPDLIFERLEALLTDVARGGLERHHRVSAAIQLDILRERLRGFAGWHADWIAEGWTVRGVEVGPANEGAILDVDGVPVRITARVDRVDFHPADRRWAVFDYKTTERGDGPRKTHGPSGPRDWKDLQLPLYRWMLPMLVDGEGERVVGDEPVDDILVGYIKLPADANGVGLDPADWTVEEHEDALETARDVVRRLRDEAFTFDPGVRASWSDPRMDALLGIGTISAPDEEDDVSGDGLPLASAEGGG